MGWEGSEKVRKMLEFRRFFPEIFMPVAGWRGRA